MSMLILKSIKERIRKNKIVVIISLINSVILLILTYILNNQSLFTGENLNQYAWMEFIKEKCNLSQQGDYKDALFINVAYDKKLVNIVDDYEKLSRILSMLDSTKQYKYIFLDIIFEKGYEDPEYDSTLFAKIKSMKNIVIAKNEDVEIVDTTLLEKASFNNYTSTIIETNFARYKFSYKGEPSMPLFAYKDLTGKTINNHGILYFCENKLCYNSLFLQFPPHKFPEYNDKGEKMYYHLGNDILKEYNAETLGTLSKNKYVFIDNMVDNLHDTYSGMKPAAVITYHALHSLLDEQHIVSFKLIFFLGVVFFVLSLSLFDKKPILTNIPFIRRSNSKFLHFVVSFIAYSIILVFIVVLLYMFFNVSISIFIPSLYFSLQKIFIDYKRFSKS